MKRILVSMLQEEGHLNPSFKVSRTLRARGFDVQYLAIPDLAGHVESQGFETIAFLPKLFPKGSAERLRALDLLGRRRVITRQFQAVTEHLLDPRGFRETLGAVKPDLVIIDVNQTTLQLLAWQLGIPVVAMNTSLPQTREPGIPPLRSGATYRPGLEGRILGTLAWMRYLARRRLVALAAGPLGIRPPYELARRAASRFGYPRSDLDCDTAYMPRLAGVPELVLSPPGFDFPRPPMPGRVFAESIDLERAECPFPWERLDASKPLIFVSMGSQHYEAEAVRRFLRLATEALRSRPGWQAVVAVGHYLEPEALSPCPPNVVVVRTAPQLAILKRAAVMVTHGGLGSVKECILRGAPMVVFPLAIDQPDNAERVRYHRLGIRGDVRGVSRLGLLHMLDEVTLDRGYRERTASMAKAFEAIERGTPGADFVATILSP